METGKSSFEARHKEKQERQEICQLRKEITCTDQEEIARAKEVIRKDGRHRHGEVGFYLAQALSGHGCSNAYLRHSRNYNIRKG